METLNICLQGLRSQMQRIGEIDDMLEELCLQHETLEPQVYALEEWLLQI